MGQNLKCFFLSLIALTFVGCGPTFVQREPLGELNFKKFDSYEIDLTQIPKPEKIKRQYLNDHFDLVETADEASFVLLVPSEYAKIEALLDIIIAYKDIIYKQGDLINIKIDIINAKAEFLELERQKAQAYRDMWVDSENAYRQEKFDRSKDSFMYKTLISIITIGSTIAILALI